MPMTATYTLNLEKAAQRVLNSITQYVEGELKLRVNRDKSGTFRP